MRRLQNRQRAVRAAGLANGRRPRKCRRALAQQPSRAALQGQANPYLPAWSPEPCAHLAQHRLLPLLAQRVAALAPEGVELRMGHRLAGFEQDGEGVSALVEGPQVWAGGRRLPCCVGGAGRQAGMRRRAEGGCNYVLSVQGPPTPAQGEAYHVRSPYLLAADGARGGVRSALGIGMEGPGGIQHLINVHFISPEVPAGPRGAGQAYSPFSACSPAALQRFCSPTRPSVCFSWPGDLF